MLTENDRSLSPFLQTGAITLDACCWGAERLLKQWLELHTETARFLARRSQRNLEFLRRLYHCRGPQDVLELQQQWQKQAGADYSEELGRLAGLNLGLISSSMASIQPPVSQAAKPKRNATPLAA